MRSSDKATCPGVVAVPSTSPVNPPCGTMPMPAALAAAQIAATIPVLSGRSSSPASRLVSE